MRGETQSLHLAKMIQKHKLYPEYELILSFLLVKKKCVKKFSKGDILLIGDEAFKFKAFKR